MAPNRILLSLLILSTLISISSAGGGRRMAVEKPPGTSPIQELSKKIWEGEDAVLRHRILRVKTNDYENYEPSPTLSKPPFKLIPN